MFPETIAPKPRVGRDAVFGEGHTAPFSKEHSSAFQRCAPPTPRSGPPAPQSSPQCLVAIDDTDWERQGFPTISQNVMNFGSQSQGLQNGAFIFIYRP